MTNVFSPLTLPNGSVLKNRIAKSAMEEDMAGYGQVPENRLIRLYERWAEGGAGLIITGNVFIDRRYITAPGALVLEKDTPLEGFKALAAAGKKQGSLFWLQLNHPGGTLMKDIAATALSPSGVSLKMGRMSNRFVEPKIIIESEIIDVIQRFADSAKAAFNAGFDGIQLHAAHGYLFTQFLSPLTNQRNDNWGGRLENRARILLETVKAVRKVVPRHFGVAVKINSADFQRGGFEVDDAKLVVTWLNDLGMDLVELSGGTYESGAMLGFTNDQRTLSREAYFLSFASDISKVAKMPVMTTGGIRRKEVAESVLAAGVDIVGVGFGFAQFPDLAIRWKNNESPSVKFSMPKWKNKSLASLALILLVRRQFYRIGNGKNPRLNDSAVMAILHDQWRRWKLIKKYKKWLNTVSLEA